MLGPMPSMFTPKRLLRCRTCRRQTPTPKAVYAHNDDMVSVLCRCFVRMSETMF